MADARKEALNCETLFLKVSIHCEGCKKKVKRVLRSMPEVFEVEIDSFQHKVAVTCNVDHQTLIRKLQKSGKQASVWPEVKKPCSNQTPNTSSDNQNQNNGSNSKPKDKEPKESSEKPKDIQTEQTKDKSSDKGVEKEKEKEKPQTEDETKSKPQEKEKEREKDKEKDVVKEKPKEKEEKPKEQSEQEAKPNGSSENKKGKKEEKKNESSGKEGEQHVERGISPSQPNQDFMYPYSYPYPAQPIMSYHMSQPTSSQAFYQQPPMPGTQGYMYPYQNPYSYPYQYPYGAPNEYSYGTSTESSARGDDTLNYFNEENANSCSVM